MSLPLLLEDPLILQLCPLEESASHHLTSEIWISEGPGPATGGPSDIQMISPGGECFAPSTPKNMIMEIKNSSFGFDLTFETLLI